MAQSARGLFRATGTARKPVAQLGLDGQIVQSEHLEREPNDFYPTPPAPTWALIREERHRLSEIPLIWEPAAGDGAMVRELSAAGLPCVASDLIDRGCGAEIRDFFDYRKARAPAIVTNPPFNKCNWRDGKGAWIDHALGVLGVDYMALLLPLTWPGAAGLSDLLRRLSPARVYLMQWKVDFTGEGSPPMYFTWVVWDREHSGPTTLHFITRPKVPPEQRGLPL